MISPKKLIKMARKRQKLAAIRRQSIRSPKTRNGEKQPVALKGHFVVYSADQRRFVLPLVFLKTDIFRELLEIAEEEYGHNGLISVRCSSSSNVQLEETTEQLLPCSF